MVVLFIFGESLPTHIVPPEAAIIAASLALLLLVSLRGEPLEQVMRDIDWKTLVFIGAIFCMVQGVVKTGLIGGFALQLHDLVGDDFPLVALLLLASIGVLSSVVVNTPLVAAALVLTKGYLVIAEAVPESALVVVDTDWPAATLPMFVAMMFGGTLGGNATLIGASANVVSAGICAREGQRVTFLRFMRYGLPVALAQLLLAALFVVLVGRGAG
jgi:Na+/H+ antiporter NhaD/arsenite permease-like protein